MVYSIVENEIFPGRFIWCCKLCGGMVSKANAPTHSECDDCNNGCLVLTQVDQGLEDFK